MGALGLSGIPYFKCRPFGPDLQLSAIFDTISNMEEKVLHNLCSM